MLLPLKVEYAYVRQPWATGGLIAANGFLFVCQLLMPEAVLDELLLHPDTLKPWQWISSVFLHAGPLHLGGNMLFLWVYGRYVEERLGPVRFLLVYAGLGIAASLAYIAASFGESTPALGASGAISGLMGLVLAVAASARVNTVFLWGYYIRRIDIHAGFILAFWVAEQIIMGLMGSHGIAISAHLGGFAAGFMLGMLLRRESLRHTLWYLDLATSGLAGLREEREGRMWEAIAQHHRDRRTTPRPGSTYIPQWMKSSDSLPDPYEAEELNRWNRPGAR